MTAQATAKAAHPAKTTTTSPYRHGRGKGTIVAIARVQASSSEANRMPANSSRRLGALYQINARPAAIASTIRGRAIGRHAGANGMDVRREDRGSVVISPPDYDQ